MDRVTPNQKQAILDSLAVIRVMLSQAPDYAQARINKEIENVKRVVGEAE